jgi:hypothetical protein
MLLDPASEHHQEHAALIEPNPTVLVWIAPSVPFQYRSECVAGGGATLEIGKLSGRQWDAIEIDSALGSRIGSDLANPSLVCPESKGPSEPHRICDLFRGRSFDRR